MARRRATRSRRSRSRAPRRRSRSLGRTLLEMRGLRQTSPAVYQSRRIPVSPTSMFGTRSVGVPVYVGAGRRRRKSTRRRRSIGAWKGNKKGHAAAARKGWRTRRRKYGKKGRGRRKSTRARARRRSLGAPRYYTIGRPRRRYGRRRRMSRGLFGLSASTPFLGALQWLASRKGIEAGIGVLAGRSVAHMTTALGHEYLFKDAGAGDALPNIVGDVAGAAVAWELGKAVNPHIAAFAAASAATRWLQTLVDSNLTHPVVEKIAPNYYAKMSMQPASAPGGTAPEGGAAEAGMYGLGQVRISDDAALGQVRVPDIPDMSDGFAEDSLF